MTITLLVQQGGDAVTDERCWPISCQLALHNVSHMRLNLDQEGGHELCQALHASPHALCL